MRAIISGVGHYVPERKLTNQDFEKMVDTTDEWIRSRTGIQERRILDKDKGSSYMAAKAAQMVLDQRGLSAQDLKLFIPHQANFRIIDSIAGKLGLTDDQVVININRYGNTTAATIPLAMSEAYRSKRMQKGDWIAVGAFGAGLPGAACCSSGPLTNLF